MDFPPPCYFCIYEGNLTKISAITRGPAVTRYELQPGAGVKVSKIAGLSDDLALNLAAKGVRIEAPIPGKAAVKIYSPTEVYFEEELPFAQLGTTESLSKELFNKNVTTKVILDKATGGVIKIEN